MQLKDLKQEVWLGDCLELMKNISDKSVDMILCDLPYGTTACKWDIIIPFDKLWKEYDRIIKENCPILLFGTEPFSTLLRFSNLKNFKYDWIWNKERGGSPTLAKIRPHIVCENISVFNKHKYFPIMVQAEKKNIRPRNRAYKAGEVSNQASGVTKTSNNHDESKRFPKNLLTFNAGSKECNNLNRKHPTQKPVELCEYLIKTYTNEGDLILDNCAGSGSTLVAAKNLNRQFIGIEKEEKYYNIILERLKNAN